MVILSLYAWYLVECLACTKCSVRIKGKKRRRKRGKKENRRGLLGKEL